MDDGQHQMKDRIRVIPSPMRSRIARESADDCKQSDQFDAMMHMTAVLQEKNQALDGCARVER